MVYHVFTGERWQAEAKISEENETNERRELTGSILRPSQPFSLRVALDTDDVQAFSLLQSEVGLTAFAIHRSFQLVDGLQGANQLTRREEKKIITCIYHFVLTEAVIEARTKNQNRWSVFSQSF